MREATLAPPTAVPLFTRRVGRLPRILCGPLFPLPARAQQAHRGASPQAAQAPLPNTLRRAATRAILSWPPREPATETLRLPRTTCR